MELSAYKDYLFDTVQKILLTDSPSGYCDEVIGLIEGIAKENGFPFARTNKGCGVITVEGKDSGKVVGLSAHVDTLGAMVRSITDKGELKFTVVGGPILPTLDGEYCKIRTRGGCTYTGTILSESPAAHVFLDSSTRVRDEENMMIRLDEKVKCKEDVGKLGIMAGDYIFFDPKTTVTESGFLKSRFIDDKASVAILMTLLKVMKEEGLRPQHTTKIFISIYEEVGHGASYIPEDIEEFIAVDMGCVGLDLGCTEYDVSICAKDSDGPYDYELTTRLIRLAQEHNLQFAVDIYPKYGSDVGAARSAGNDVKGGLIGSGVHASHGMERTHYEGMENTLRLLLLYLGC
ncbi:MAG: aminopeptidase [Clostridiales bacterium]|uniref:Aminopeptidase FrvX n=1 Tax=Harryflintia acetispora TaxID=1849041 RepID=A0A9X8Y8J8_9FIRM|nr:MULTISPECIES: M42 family metallopeptidase [Oscillospiraceae]PWM38654.1 MAG: aminopeptidase [Clostridiales bacterium]RGB68283.1 M20/M25/M40 family metallo-hydrolase [Harryflintia acetispora]TCL43782.1 putative aminopeptidase FrvX [Harryflintia acetispora]